MFLRVAGSADLEDVIGRQRNNVDAEICRAKGKLFCWRQWMQGGAWIIAPGEFDACELAMPGARDSCKGFRH